jgi:hypothetical protein
MLEAVRSAVEAWGTPSDDVTLLICKYLAPGETARAAAKEVAAGE